LRLQPVARFVNGAHFRRELPRQRDGVVDVVEVAMRDADRIYAFDLVAFGISGIAIGPRVHEDDLARGKLKLKGAVSKPGDLHQDMLLTVKNRRRSKEVDMPLTISHSDSSPGSVHLWSTTAQRRWIWRGLR